jgi:hypothetical protein
VGERREVEVRGRGREERVERERGERGLIMYIKV